VSSPSERPRAVEGSPRIPFWRMASTAANPCKKSAGWQTLVFVNSDDGPSKQYLDSFIERASSALSKSSLTAPQFSYSDFAIPTLCAP